MGDDRQEKFAAWKIVLIVQWIALLIGLAMPITPSRTGGDFSLAEWFFEDPSYLQAVLVYFLLTNLVIGVLFLIAMALAWRERRSEER